MSPGLSYAMQSGFGSGGSSASSSRVSSSKAVVVKKIETRDGKLVSQSSDVLSKRTTTVVPPSLPAPVAAVEPVGEGAVQGSVGNERPT